MKWTGRTIFMLGWTLALLLPGISDVFVCAQDQAAQPPRAPGQSQLSAQHPAVVAAKERADTMAKAEEELRMRLREQEQELRKLREIMREVNGGRPIEGLKEAVGTIQRDAARMRIDLAGIGARKDVIEEAIAKAREEAAKRAGQQDVITNELQELVKLLEQSVKRAESLVKTGQVAAAEVSKAQVELAEAKVRLLDRQQSVLKQSGGTDISRLTDQLTELSASLIETQARLRAMDDVLGTYDKLQQYMDQEQEVRWQVGKVRGMIEHVERLRLDDRLGVTGGAPTKGRE